MRTGAHVKGGNEVTAASDTCRHDTHDDRLARFVILEQRTTRVALATAAEVATAPPALVNITRTHVLDRVDRGGRLGLSINVSAKVHRGDWDVDLENCIVVNIVVSGSICSSVTCNARRRALLRAVGVI